MFGPRENVCWFRNSREWRIIHTSGMKRVAFSLSLLCCMYVVQGGIPPNTILGLWWPNMHHLGNKLWMIMARIICSWQCCRLLFGNIANGIASKNFFVFLTELGNFKQKIFWRQCHCQCCQTKVCSIAKSR